MTVRSDDPRRTGAAEPPRTKGPAGAPKDPTAGPDDVVHQLDRHFAKLATLGVQPDNSISRIAWSDEESAAIAYLRAEGEAFGLEGRYDAVGNLILSSPVASKRRLLVGSHLDSVPHGGNYDGAAGVVAGLEALRLLQHAGVSVGVDLVSWRGEEHTYNAVYKGSAAAFGLSETHILHNTYGSQSLRDAIRSQGFDPSPIDESRPSLSPDYVDQLAGYFELHIEQGVRLEREGTDLGIVTSIAGDRRYLIVLEGRFDHSGATPMGRNFRSDVNLAMAYIQTRLDELGAQRRSEGQNFVQTIGIVNADPEIDKRYPDVHNNSVTKVSGMGYCTLDLMSADDEFMDRYAAEVHRLIWSTAKEHGVTAVIEQLDCSQGLSELSPPLQSCLEESSRESGYSSVRMPSGAGHDAVMVAAARNSRGEGIPVGMLFVPCRKGISHSRDEFASHEAVARGAEVLAKSFLRLSKTDASLVGPTS